MRSPAPRKAIFAHLPDEELLRYGVPAEWLADVRRATEDTVLALADHLPAEAVEALLELATGGSRAGPRACRSRSIPSSARDHLLVTNVKPASESLDDLR